MMKKNIDSSDISVVVQGAIEKDNIIECLSSIRKSLPKAEIILSTWEGSDTKGLDYDILVENKDPGSFPCDEISNSVPNNINRQLVSTKNGLDKVQRKYALKLRTDFKINSNEFLNYYNEYNVFDKEFSYFEQRIVACSVYSRNPRYKFDALVMPYCPSDFFFFGLTNDVKRLFDIDLITSNEDKRYFEVHSERQPERTYPIGLCRFMPEQFLWIGFLKKYIKDLHCEHRDHINAKNIILTEKTFANNFVLASNEQLGINSFMYNLFNKGVPETCFTHDDWLCLYKKYCLDDDFSFLIYRLKIKLKDTYYKKKHKRNIQKLERNLYLINQDKISKLSQVVKKSEKHEYVSLDIFDTLLFRNVDPTWIPLSKTGLYIEMLLKELKPSLTATEINNLRDTLIRENNKISMQKGFDAEYLLDDIVVRILQNLNVSEDLIPNYAAQIVANEVKREIDCLYLNPDAINTLRKLKEANKKIIAISDMYLSRKDIIKVLESFGIYEYFDDVYVSSEYKLVKHSGNAFKKIIELFNIPKLKWIHIGDNLYSDVLAPNKLGIKTLWYKDEANIKRKEDLSDYMIHRKNKKQFIAKKFPSLLNKAHSFESVVRNKVAVDLNNFVFEMLISAYCRGIKAICFLERDGNIFK